MNQAGRRSAILIGSSQFDKEPLKAKPLKCPERDVDGMHELLAATELGAFGEVFVFKNSHHQAALDQIEEVLTTAARDDQVLIYYSGHGETDLPGRLYLTATNTDTKKLVSTSIPIETLRTMIENSLCRKIILILDCCFGGAAGKSFVKGSVDEKLKELARGYGIYILTASTAAQTAQEREGDDYGLLTKHIISGIKEGAAANDEGFISMDGLYRYVHRQVTGEGYQEPMHWALNVKGEDLIIARAAALYSAQQLLDFKKLINRLDEDEEIAGEICAEVRLVIQQNQPKRDKRLFELLAQLHKGVLKPGKFVSLWSRGARVTSQPAQTTLVAPPSGGTEPGAVATGQSREPAPHIHPVPAPKVHPVASAPNAHKKQDKTTNDFTDDMNGVKLEMVYISGGTFKMGSPNGSSEANDDATANERPQHDVTVPAFYIGKFQITQTQWKAVMGDKLKPEFSGDDLPMESVLWEEAKEFCRKLRKITNKAYRLPSEAEWEYACRAGTTTEYAFGDLLSSDQANFNGKYPYGKAMKNIYRAETTSICGFDPNAFGLFDMHGNVCEWCEDVWNDDYSNAPTDGSAWLSGDPTYRVHRGGSWYDFGFNCRSAFRNKNAYDYRLDTIGFRIAVSART